MIYAEQPHRVTPPRRGRWNSRTWPCGHTDGGWLAGPADECRAADVILEDAVAPPAYSSLWQGAHSVRVTSTHDETRAVYMEESFASHIYVGPGVR